MCGIAGIFGDGWDKAKLEAMMASQRHRGPDDEGIHIDPGGRAGLAHNRLSIIDLSLAGHQPMPNRDGSVWVIFNGEIYNFLELRAELSSYPYRSHTDTEVILAAYERWGDACVEHLFGMFAFLIWEAGSQRLFAARDRFGVKPLYYYQQEPGRLLIASEIRALHAAGVPSSPDPVAWASYLAFGLSDHSERTFWENIRSLPAGHMLVWQDGRTKISSWYKLEDRVGLAWDSRPVQEVQEEYLALLAESVRLRFRSDVQVGINLSGGLDSSTLLGLVQAVQDSSSDVKAFTFVTGDPEYDELPWVQQMLSHTGHRSLVCHLEPQDVPALAESVQAHQYEPFGGLPTLAYAGLFEQARAEGTTVLLDGQGMDEQWAGYDYYASALNGKPAGVVQGMSGSPLRPECLAPEFRALAEPLDTPRPFPDSLRNVQYRDIRYTKLPKALRFNDRISMRCSTELREPFLDHRLVELALRQPAERKIVSGTRKWLLRRIARELLPNGVVEAPKRPVQTPQREWIRGPLSAWAAGWIEQALHRFGGAWLEPDRVRKLWCEYRDHGCDSSFHTWQWVNLGLMTTHE